MLGPPITKFAVFGPVDVGAKRMPVTHDAPGCTITFAVHGLVTPAGTWIEN